MEIEENNEENNYNNDDEIIVPDYVYDDNNNSQYEVLNPDQICDCIICGTSDKRSDIIICDRCDRDYHYACLKPPLKQVPSGDWYCPKCMKIMESEGMFVYYFYLILEFFMEEESIGHEIQIYQYLGPDDDDNDIFEWKRVYLLLLLICYYQYRLLNYDDEKKRFIIVEDNVKNDESNSEYNPKKYYFIPEKCECLLTKSINWFKASDYPWWPGKVTFQYKYSVQKEV